MGELLRKLESLGGAATRTMGPGGSMLKDPPRVKDWQVFKQVRELAEQRESQVDEAVELLRSAVAINRSGPLPNPGAQIDDKIYKALDLLEEDGDG